MGFARLQSPPLHTTIGSEQNGREDRCGLATFLIPAADPNTALSTE